MPDSHTQYHKFIASYFIINIRNTDQPQVFTIQYTMVSAVSSSPLNPSPPHPQQQHRALPRPQKKAMSVTQTYFLAHKARAKLSHEAGRPDHNLRLLVGHANLLDSLMLDLADAEREQESWFTQSVHGASPASSKTEERHIQWSDSVVEEDWEADSSDSDSDSDVDSDVEMEDVAPTPLSRIPSQAIIPSSPILQPMDAEFDDDDEEEDYDSLTLTRSQSHSISPPELDHDSDSSDDESMPPSPPTATIPSFSQKQRDATVTTKYLDPRQEEEEDDKSDFYNEGYYLPPRNPTRLVSAITVY